MDTFLTILLHPFTWGLALGFVFAALSWWNHGKTKREFGRYRRHLSDKLEIEAEQHSRLKEQKDQLAQENENLRIKIGSSKGEPARELERELEIYARAERAMYQNAPGFAGAWEAAKTAAANEIREEERGKSLSNRIFRKFFRGDGKGDEAVSDAVLKELPDKSDEEEKEKSEAKESKAQKPETAS